jgi:hypothetical protein
MNMRDNIGAFYRLLTTDETLLRLLFYKPTNANDSPLLESKVNILTKPTLEKWQIINGLIFTTPKTDDLTTTPQCRLMLYPGRRKGTSNYLVADQLIVIDVLVHFDFENVDLRMEWICDRVNELIFDKRVTGIGKVEFEDGSPIASPVGYVGFRMVYKIGSVN